MPEPRRMIVLHAAAPAKPAAGAPCNGCGAYCAAAPCPVSTLLLGHVRGACPALHWDATGARYVCGMLVATAQYLPRLPARLLPLAQRVIRRWIAAGRGCDFAAELEAASATQGR